MRATEVFGMLTDTERREVARRLRELDDSELQVYDMTYFAIQSAVGCEGDQCPDGRKLVDRLADLIEPSIPADPGEAGLACVDAFIREHTEKPVDRDALLRLSDEIYDTSCDNYGELTVDLIDIWGWAQAICEACGVVD